jgi:anthranilate phosphoribosyltransferase
MKEYLDSLLCGHSFDFDGAESVMNRILSHKATPAQLGSFLTGMRLKGVTSEELAGFASAMRSRALRVSAPPDDLTDIVGTGGDGLGTFNISTTAALIAAAAGAPVAKQGGVGVSSHCGSANVLYALGIKIDGGPKTVIETLESIGIGFMYASLFHPTVMHYDMPRYELGFSTVFEMLMPLVNPLNVRRLVIGVDSPERIGIMAGAARRLGVERALVVSSSDGMDEFSLGGVNHIVELYDGSEKSYDVSAEDMGLPVASAGDLKGGDPETNAAILIDVLQGRAGPCLDAAVFNAGAALYVAERTESIRAGVTLARETIAAGKAHDLFQAWRDFPYEHTGS